MRDDKLVRLSDAISTILEEKISGQQLEIMYLIGVGTQVETLNQACDRHAQYIRDLPAVDAVEVVRCDKCWFRPKGQTYCTELERHTGDGFYCAFGQRREE